MIEKRHDVFISYAHKDNPEPERPITQLVELLKATYRDRYGEEISVFFDEDGLQPGDSWENKLLESLRQSAVMIVILSSDYYGSEYCYKEWRHFQDVEIHYSLPGEGIIANQYREHDPRMPNPIAIEEAALNVWINDLGKRQYHDIRDWETNRDMEVFQQRLLAVCEQIHERKRRLEERKKIISNVRPHNPNFTGRAEQIHTIHEALIQNSIGVITAIKGIGGIGKSTIAYEYAHAYVDYYQGGTFNFNAEKCEDFRTALASIAAVAGMEFTEEERKNLDLQCLRVWRHLSQGPPALLILDNVDKEDILERATIETYVMDRHKLHILVTSRQGFAPGDDIVEVLTPPLEQSPSLDLLLKLFPAKDDAEWKAANSITRRLGGHPLALTMVGTYLANKKNMSYAIQLKWLEDEGIGALDRIGEGKVRLNYANPVPTKIFEQTFSLLTGLGIRVLEYAALLPPDSIPIPWLYELVKDEFPEIVHAPEAFNEPPWDALLEQLEKFQLLIPSAAEPRIGTMHRLVQDAIRRRHENGSQYGERLLDYANSRAKFLRKEDGWILHANRWEIKPLGQLALHDMEDESKLGYLANQTALVEKDLGDLETAKRLLKRAIEIGEKTFEPDHPTLATRYSNLALVEKDLGDLETAKRLLKRAVEIEEKTFEPDHPTLATSYSNLALVEQDLGDLETAKRLLNRAIEIEEKTFGQDHPTLATFYSNLALVEKDLGDLPHAIFWMRKALVIAARRRELQKNAELMRDWLSENDPNAEEFLAEQKQEIPPIVFGIVGHRNLSRPEMLGDALRRVLTDFAAEFERAAIVSPLAKGADRLAVEAVFDVYGENAGLVVLLPFELEEYRKDFDTEEDRTEFERLLNDPRQIRVGEPEEDVGNVSDPEVRNLAYWNAGKRVVDRCQILLVVWNGEPAAGVGGTGDIVQYAQGQGKSLIWIHSETCEIRTIDNGQ